MSTWQLQLPIAPHALPRESLHKRPAQHMPALAHVWPALAQLAGSQVPATPLWVVTQLWPAQQSALVVHTAPCGWHTLAMPHLPPTQVREQQSALELQPASLASHNRVPPSAGNTPPSGKARPPSGSAMTPPSLGTWQALPNSPAGRHSLPMQHSPDIAQLSPTVLQLKAPAQCRPPSKLGTQGAEPQHWSLNWHAPPAAMQHGAVPV